MTTPSVTPAAAFAPIEAAAAKKSGKKTDDGRVYGHLGCLTPEQEQCLCRMWDGLLAFLDNNQDRLKELGYADMFTEIKLKSADNDNEACSASKAPEPVATPTEEGSNKRKTGFWGGISSGIGSMAAGATRSRTSTSNANKKSSGGSTAEAATGNSCVDGIVHTSDRAVTHEELKAGFLELILHDHPDSLLLRFLRARRWNVGKALLAGLLTIQWRVRENIADIIRNGEWKLNLNLLKSGESFIYNVDKRNRPLCYVNVRYHNKDQQPFDDLRRFTIWVMETCRMMIHPPVETASLVFNLADFTMANMDYNSVKFMIQCFQAYYPESLGLYTVVNAPWIFWGIWKVITPWLDPVVVSKFNCARKSSDLLDFIDPSALPTSLGGTSNYEYKYVEPRKEDDYRLEDEKGRAKYQAELDAVHQLFLEKTRQWIATNSDDKAAIKNILAERDQIAKDIRVAYFKLDPYVRSRTLYHRLGVLGEDGSCDWSRLRFPAECEAKTAKQEQPAVVELKQTTIMTTTTTQYESGSQTERTIVTTEETTVIASPSLG